jgi:hypothetical protein
MRELERDVEVGAAHIGVSVEGGAVTLRYPRAHPGRPVPDSTADTVRAP